jgi:thymidylate synthase
MPELHVNDMQAGYLELVGYVKDHGVRRSPRGLPTRDVEDMTVVLHDPTRALTEHIGRKASTRLAALEAAQLVAGESWPELMTRVAPNTARFLSDDGTFHGAYGPRLATHMPHVIRRLTGDPDTRQAVANIYDAHLDLSDGLVDVPCNVMVMYKIQDDTLHAKTVVRSNDVWWGVAHDVFMFTVLQRTIAEFIGVGVGRYRHSAYSMHIYDSVLPDTDQLHPPTKPAQVAPPLWTAEDSDVDEDWTWHDVQSAASMLRGPVVLPGSGDWWDGMALTW